MEENTTKRKVKTPEEKIADIDKKIERYKEMIATLQQKKKDIIKPKRKSRVTKKMVQDSLKTLVEGGVLTEEEAQQNLEKFAGAK